MAHPDDLLSDLRALAHPDQVAGVARFFKGGDPETQVLGVPIGKVFPVAKRHVDMSLAEVEQLLEDVHYEVRMAAVSILDFKARQKRLPEAERRALYELYLRRHDRINNWDLVDRAAPFVIGEYLVKGDRGVLDVLARSDDPHERRTAIVATYAFLKRGEVADTFRIAGLLAGDSDDYVQKAIASWTREAGKHDAAALIAFLEAYRAHLPRSVIAAASKRLPEETRARLRRNAQAAPTHIPE